ncbi:conserved Plasmodium protein, unknown function [Plasmodium gallinaceum]|uniref:Uncharacterized protein n=1 Tax=Plasmodium gallinaceum TaxID=5849 RepID=A0A1J1GPA7_PLAGA|nr:conserved Plasmodium protein, unknown function [Plasmodium gallinaceum]CRG94132.1 conserved Plasmodium protein, unknown function [Plasmodium gallinaceum]
MVLKEKKNKKYSSKYNKKSKGNNSMEKDTKKKNTSKNEFYDENDLPYYDSNDDFLIKNNELFYDIFKYDDELNQVKKQNIEPSSIIKEKEKHSDFVITSIAFNIPVGMI